MDNSSLLALVIPQIDREESCRLTAYLDSRGIPTIGWGRADSGVQLGMTCTQPQADQWRNDKLNAVCAGLDSLLSWWRSISLERQAVLVEMAYQMGIHGLLAFHRALTAVEDGDWAAAKAGMLNSKWAMSDSPGRAAREAQQMLTGIIA